MNSPTFCNEMGMVWPVVNRDRCLADADCIAVCPHDVLAVHVVPREQYDDGWSSADGKHPLRQARVVAPDRCGACGLCVAACAQQAIILRGRYEGADAMPSGRMA